MPVSSARVQALAKIISRFNKNLEDRIRLALLTERMRRCHPNESIFIKPAIWTPSVQSLSVDAIPQAPILVSGLKINSNAQFSLLDVPEASEVDPEIPRVGDDCITGEGEDRGSAIPVSSSQTSQIAVWSEAPAPSSSSRISAMASGQFLDSRSQDRDHGDAEDDPEPALSVSKYEVIHAMLRSTPQPKSLIDVFRDPKSEVPVIRNGLETLNSSWVHLESGRSILHGTNAPPKLDANALLPAYEQLTQGIPIQREVTAMGRPIMFSTRYVHLTLSLDALRTKHNDALRAPEGKDKIPSSTDGKAWVTVKWLKAGEGLIRSEDGVSNMVTLDSAARNLEHILTHGASASSIPLYLVHKADDLGVKYTPEAILALE